MITQKHELYGVEKGTQKNGYTNIQKNNSRIVRT